MSLKSPKLWIQKYKMTAYSIGNQILTRHIKQDK